MASSSTFLTRIKFLLLVIVAPGLVFGERDTLSQNELSEYWFDARDVLEDLDQYQALWIKIHGCV